MRFGSALLVATTSALLAFAVPGLARNSETPQAGEQAAAAKPSACRSYQQATDGSWAERPCQALGTPDPVQNKSATRKSDEQTR